MVEIEQNAGKDNKKKTLSSLGASVLINVRFNRHSHVALLVGNLPANAGDARDAASIPGSGKLGFFISWLLPFTVVLCTFQVSSTPSSKRVYVLRES